MTSCSCSVTVRLSGSVTGRVPSEAVRVPDQDWVRCLREHKAAELKTHQPGPRTVLRSKSPKLVTQEIWGHLCCHYAIRTLMLDAAQGDGRNPNRVSFVARTAHL